MSYFLYILQMSNGQLYVGTSSNLPARFSDHFKHRAARTTSVLGAEKVLYTETYPDRTTAEKRERQIKKWSHAKKMALAQRNFKLLKKLSRRKI